MSFLSKFKKPIIIFPFLLIVIELIIFATNFKFGTYLIGWDNIMPEFNLGLNLERSIFSIWQEYRGLGVLDGLSHAANLMHTIYIGILSLFLPDSILRYIYIHLTHLVGGITFFFLARKLIKNNAVSFVGALFYMLNIGVIQLYFAPLEVFATHFVALPLLALFITNTLEKTNIKNVLILFISALLVSQQGFVPTVFIAFSVLFGFLLLINILQTRKIKPALIVFFVVVLANMFWGLPYLYSALNTAENIASSRINQFSSEEIFFRNQAFGDITSVIGLKGFMIDTIELSSDDFTNVYFMDTWRNHTGNIFYQAVFLVFLGLMILGAGLTIFKKKLDFLPYLLTFIVGFFFLANDTPVFKQANIFIRDTFPLVGEAFRFPFTKFETLFAFTFSILLTFGLLYIVKRFHKYQYIILGGVLLALVFISYPAFLGNFTSPFLRLEIPKDYAELFDYMGGIPPENRVALLPAQTFWNWQYKSWGHRGSGFIWHGLPQPVLLRAFDPWSPYDEQFYNEMGFAINTQDEVLFDQIVRKYDLSYLLLDQYILNSLSQREINYESLKKFLDRSPSVSVEKKFGKLILYKTNIQGDWIYTLDKNSTRQVVPNYSFEKLDSIYGLTDNYVTSDNIASVINLFPSLFSEKLQKDMEFNVKNSSDNFVLSPKENLDYDLSKFALRVPSLFETEYLVPVSVNFKNGALTLTPLYPDIYINRKRLELESQTITLTAEYLVNPETITFVDTAQEISLNEENPKAYLLNNTLNSIMLTDKFGNKEKFVLDTTQVDRRSFFAKLPGGKVDSIEIVIPKINTSLSYASIIKNKNYEIRKNTSGPFTKDYSYLTSKTRENSVSLIARDGSTELTFFIPGLYQGASYILFSDTSYKSGLPLRFYIDNDTDKKAEVEAIFSKENKENIVVIPKANRFFKGYGFHFISKSVGKELSENSIESIEIYPFPAGLIRNLQFIDNDFFEHPFNLNPKIKTKYNKINNVSYTAENVRPNSYLVLSQAYDDEWRAYKINNQSSIINNLSRVFPFLAGEKLENHVLVNNWANGWEIQPSVISSQSSEVSPQSSDIVILYLPYFIQLHGQIISAGTLITLIVIFISKNKRRKNHHTE